MSLVIIFVSLDFLQNFKGPTMRKMLFSMLLLLFAISIDAQVIEKPRGCFAGTNGTNPNVLAHPDARGVLLVEKWSDIEPSPGVFDFSDLDTKISTVTNAGLKYSLAIAGGDFGSPGWLVDSLGASSFSFNYQSQNWELPLWWDNTVRQRLDSLVVVLGNRYAQDTFLSHVYVTQMTVNGIEGHLNSIDMNLFTSSGFTDQNWISSAKATAYKFAAAFPNKPIVFEIHEINSDTLVPAIIINDLYNDSSLCHRIGLGMWWISGKTSYQSDLITYIDNFQGDKYAQIIGRSDQTYRFKDSLYSTVFDQAKDLNIRYIEPWPYEFQNHTYDSLFQDFNIWADANFSSTGVCSIPNGIAYNSGLEGLRFYPNPTSGMLYLDIETPYQKLDIEIFSLTGQLVLTVNNQLNINMAALADGLYLIRIRVDEKIITKKLRLQK